MIPNNIGSLFIFRRAQSKMFGSIFFISSFLFSTYAYGIKPCLQAQEALPKKEIPRRVEVYKPKSYLEILWVKNPTFTYMITSDKLSDIPNIIRKHMGTADYTGATYDDAYMKRNIGSVIVLQMKEGQDGKVEPDFYVMEQTTYSNRQKYQLFTLREVVEIGGLQLDGMNAIPELKELLDAGDPNLAGVLKIVPVKIFDLEDLGFLRDQRITIIASYGGYQTKPAGQKGFVTEDPSHPGEYYKIEADINNNPQNYRPAP